MRNHRVILTITIAALVTGVLAFAGCSRHRSPEERIAHKLDHVGYYLDLDEKQKARLQEVKGEILRAREELRNDHTVLFDELLAEIQNERLDQAKLVKLLERHHAQVMEVAPGVIAQVAELHASLTPEQKAKAVERLEWAREKMKSHGHDDRM